MSVRTRGFSLAFVALCVLAGLRLWGLATFIVDPSETRFVAHHEDDFGIRHNCFTCYVIAAHLGEQGKNVYDHSLYRNASEKTFIHDQVGETFTIDSYPYPAPFLAVPALLIRAGGDFFDWRIVWFVVVGSTFLLAVGLGAAWCGAFRDQPWLLLFPLIFLAPTTCMALQMGNVHALVLGASILGALAFARGWNVVGGLLLGLAICTKIWPAILLVPLVLRGRWRPVGFTLGGVVVWAGLALILVGPAPFEDFVAYQLPRLADGEAFAFMSTSPKPIDVNTSVFGVPHKLHRLGVLEGEQPRLNPDINLWYTGSVVLLVLLVAVRRRGDPPPTGVARLHQLQLWLALLNLAQLRSPFLPWPYGVVSSLWLLLLLVPRARPALRGVLLAGCVILAVDMPLPFGSADVSRWWSLAGSGIMLFAALSVVVLSLLRPGRPAFTVDGHPAR
ncbi:MAG: hypothetical protein CMJ83_19490 [Planctomycetes bacterium]|nr:hypothetical protein [Planctomycetota bacterium]